MNGEHCDISSSTTANQLCGTVTVCEPGTTHCQTIRNVIVDTGSSGLRLFASVLDSLHLTPLKASGGDLAECIQYADGSSEWGTVVSADVGLGEEPAVTVPIHLIDANYAKPPALCTSSQSTPDISPDQSHFNGVLGIGLFRADCGDACVQDAHADSYYSCSTAACTAVATSVQVQNPVALLPSDNNGIIIKLPAVGSGGVTALEGTILFGIGTQDNNMPGQVTTYRTDTAGNFTTVFPAFKTTPITSFIDSGSTILFLPAVSSLPLCTDTDEKDYFCPTSTQSLTATNVADGGAPSGLVSFEIANAHALFSSDTNRVFSNLGQSSGRDASAEFDWGLPFFFGRTIYVGFDGASSSLGSGTYWAY